MFAGVCHQNRELVLDFPTLQFIFQPICHGFATVGLIKSVAGYIDDNSFHAQSDVGYE